MSLRMTHDDVQAALAAEALDALSAEERAGVLAHVAECRECEAELRAMRETAASLAWLAPPRPVDPARSDRIRARLVARAAADARPAGSRGEDRTVIPFPGPVQTAPPARGSRTGWWAAAAAVVLMLAAGGYALTLRERVASLDARVAAADRERTDLRARLREREATLGGLVAPEVRVIDLAASGVRAPSGRMFWNPATNRWTFFAHGLPRLRAGRDYQLWLITPAGPIGAGTFRPGADGQAVVRATYALPADQLRAVAVTEEPAGGLPQPSGQPLILGSASE